MPWHSRKVEVHCRRRGRSPLEVRVRFKPTLTVGRLLSEARRKASKKGRASGLDVLSVEPTPSGSSWNLDERDLLTAVVQDGERVWCSGRKRSRSRERSASGSADRRRRRRRLAKALQEDEQRKSSSSSSRRRRSSGSSSGSSSSGRSGRSGEPVEPAPAGRQSQLSSAVAQASACQAQLVGKWRELARPRRRKSPLAAPAELAHLAMRPLLTRWLQARGLCAVLKEVPAASSGWLHFQYTPTTRVVQPAASWEQAFHGTWWYALWLILFSGVVLESDNEAAGHEFWHKGVFCSPSRETAGSYMRPQHLFGDGMYHRVMLEVRFDRQQLRRERKRGGQQLVLPTQAVAINSVLVQVNAPPEKGEERMDDWQADLEALPPGFGRPAVISARDPIPMEEECAMYWEPEAQPG